LEDCGFSYEYSRDVMWLLAFSEISTQGISAATC
jgi:hypothetical protein